VANFSNKPFIGIRQLAAGTALCALLAISTASAAQSDPTPPADDPAEQKISGCIEGLEGILPGEYYGCRALYNLQREHYARAVDMLEEAGYWANKNAQYMLGLIYFNGDTGNIAMNRPLGLAWMALAAERGNPDFRETYARARARLSPAEIDQATKLYLKLKLKYGDKVAGTRAIRRYNHSIQPMEEAARSGGIAYINGFSPFPEVAQALVNDLHSQAERDFQGLEGVVTVGAVQPGASSAQIRPAASK
jgi:TPR repeat protein